MPEGWIRQHVKNRLTWLGLRGFFVLKDGGLGVLSSSRFYVHRLAIDPDPNVLSLEPRYFLPTMRLITADIDCFPDLNETL
jgi:hypothetical protein